MTPATRLSEQPLQWAQRSQKAAEIPLRPVFYFSVFTEFQLNGNKSLKDSWQEDPEEEEEHLPEEESEEDDEREEDVQAEQVEGITFLSAENLGQSLRQEGGRHVRGGGFGRDGDLQVQFPFFAQASLLPSCGSRTA